MHEMFDFMPDDKAKSPATARIARLSTLEQVAAHAVDIYTVMQLIGSHLLIHPRTLQQGNAPVDPA